MGSIEVAIHKVNAVEALAPSRDGILPDGLRPILNANDILVLLQRILEQTLFSRVIVKEALIVGRCSLHHHPKAVVLW